MKICHADNCDQQFEPHTANHKYADKECRRSIDSSGLCKFRREKGLFQVPKDPVTGETPISDPELRVAFTRLQQEYNKLKTKNDDLANAVYQAVKEDIADNKNKPIAKPVLRKQKGGEEVAVAVIAVPRVGADAPFEVTTLVAKVLAVLIYHN